MYENLVGSRYRDQASGDEWENGRGSPHPAEPTGGPTEPTRCKHLPVLQVEWPQTVDMRGSEADGRGRFPRHDISD